MALEDDVESQQVLIGQLESALQTFTQQQDELESALDDLDGLIASVVQDISTEADQVTSAIQANISELNSIRSEAGSLQTTMANKVQQSSQALDSMPTQLQNAVADHVTPFWQIKGPNGYVGNQSFKSWWNSQYGMRQRMTTLDSGTLLSGKPLNEIVGDIWNVDGTWRDKVQALMSQMLVQVDGIGTFSIREIVQGMLDGTGNFGSSFMQMLYSRQGAGSVKSALEGVGTQLQAQIKNFHRVMEFANTKLANHTTALNGSNDDSLSELDRVIGSFESIMEYLLETIWALLHPGHATSIGEASGQPGQMPSTPNLLQSWSGQTVPRQQDGKTVPSELTSLTPAGVNSIIQR